MKKITTSIIFVLVLLRAEENNSVNVEEMLTTPPVFVKEKSKWKQKLSLYGWLPSLKGNYNYTIPSRPEAPAIEDMIGSSDETVSSNFIDKIDAIFMGAYEVRNDKWSFLVDGIYFKMSDSELGTVSVLGRTSVEIATEQELDLLLLNLYVGYNVVNTDHLSLDIITGTRHFYFGVNAALSINDKSLRISPSVEIYDALIGIKGDINLNKNWYIPYLFDIGAGQSNLTWQAEGSLGYRLDWGDIILTYRYIHYDKANNILINDVDLYGPKLGLVFHF